MNDKPTLAPSHPECPILSLDELLAKHSELVHQIERCGVGPELTEAVTQASDFGHHLRRYVDNVEADRSIKAANLQLLVEKVLTLEAALETSAENTDASVAGELEDQVQAAGFDMVDLARSLKQ